VASTFEFRDEDGASLSDVARLDTMVTVVDAANLLANYSSHDFLRDRGEVAGSDDHRSLVDLLVEQIEFADVIVLNKISTAAPEQREVARAIVRSLNTDARVIEVDFAKVPLDAIIETGLFDFEKAQRHPLWFRELNGFKDHVPETEEYGVRPFVYRARRPFHPARFQAFCNESWPGVIRAKGFFWLATRPSFVGELAQAGAMVRTSRRGLWWSAVPKNRWPDQPGWYESMKSYFDPVWGDRRQEIVFIGIDPMDEAAIRRRLDSCLVGDPNRFTPDAWRRLRDPFPPWPKGAT
jgi:G3E family GTPase